MAGDAVWMDVLPSLDGFGQLLGQGTTKAALAAGKTSGIAYAKSFSGAASDGGTSAVVARLEDASKKTKRVVDQQVQAITRARASERDATAKVVLAEQALADARAKFGDDSARAQAAELKLESARQRQAGAAARLVSTEDQLKAAQREHRAVTEQLATATSQAGQEAGQAPSKWGRFTSALDSAKGSVDSAGSSLEGIVGKLAAVGASAAAVGSAWAQNLALDKGTARLDAQLDLTEQQSATAGQVAGQLFADNYGESMTDVTNSVGSVVSSITSLRDASESELSAATAAAMAFSDIFEQDVSEAARNAGILISNGLAPDAVSAFDLMTASLQRVPEALRGEVMDATQEYSGFFAQMGFTGAEALGMITSATEMGQYGIDKMGDAVKEFSIRATDMSTATSAAYDALGLDTEEMTTRLLAGGDTARTAFAEIVGALDSVKDPGTQATTAIALFGTPLEDLGTSKIPQFLDALNPAASTLGDVSGKAGEASQSLQDAASTGFDAFTRSAQGLLTQGLEPLLGPATDFMNWARETPGALTALAVGVGGLAAAWGAYTVAQWIATGAATAFFTSNPAGLIATGITLAVAGLVAGITLLVQNWDSVVAWLKETWEPIGAWFSDLWQGVLDVVGSVVDWFSTSVVPVFETIWGGITAAAEGAWTVLQVIFVTWATAWSLLWDGITWAWSTFGAPLLEEVKAGFSLMWGWLSENVFAPIGQRWNDLMTGIAWVKDNILAPVWAAVQTGFGAMWGWLRDNVFAPIGQRWEQVGRGFAWVKDNVISPMWSELQTLLKAGWDWISTNVFDPIKTGVDAVGTAFEATKDLISTAWGKVKDAAAAPVNFIIETVYTNGIRKTWNSIAGAVGLDLKLPEVDPIEFADGGEYHTAQIAPAGAWRVWAEPETGGEAYIPLAPAKRGRSTAILADVAQRFGYELAPRFFADGGVWGWAGDTWDSVRGAAGKAWDWVGDKANAVKNFLKDPLGGIADLVRKPMDAVLNTIGGGDFGQMLKAIPGKVVTSLGAKVKDLVDGGGGTSGGPMGSGSVHGIAAMSAAVRALDPTARITSGYRPGAITATGVPSFHGQGRAIDIVSANMARTWDLLRERYGKTAAELFYTPRGFLRHGVMGSAAPVTRQTHYSHVHWAMANGGVISPLLFDQGGYLPPGPSVVVNNTGKPEPLARVDVAPSWGGGGGAGDQIDIRITINAADTPDEVLAAKVAAAVGDELKVAKRGGRYARA